MASINLMIDVFKRIKELLGENGIFIAVVNSSELYQYHNWLSEYTLYPENAHLKSGDLCKVKLTTIDLELCDFYWEESDYETVAKEAGFKVLQKHRPYGQREDGVPWQDEYIASPCVIYVFRKCIS